LLLDNAPARSAELLSQGRVDAALIPIIEYQSTATWFSCQMFAWARIDKVKACV